MRKNSVTQRNQPGLCLCESDIKGEGGGIYLVQGMDNCGSVEMNYDHFGTKRDSESRHSASRFLLRNKTVMAQSRMCLGYDDTYIYAVSPDSISSYDIQHGITSVSRNRASNNTDSFMTCFGHQNQLYISAVDPNGNTNFLSYRLSSTPQHQPQIGFGLQAFDTTLDKNQLNASTVVSMVPMYLSTENSNGTTKSPDQNQQQQQQSCVVISSNSPGQFNGLYQVCDRNGTSFQQIRFPDQSSTTPLLATNNAHSLIALLGYPNANSIHVYSHLDDLSKPDAIYEIDIAIPSRGFVQVLNDAATEFLIFDYSRNITHIQLPSVISKQNNVTYSSYLYELNDGQRNRNATIALANHHLFTVFDNNSNDDDLIFEEIQFGARLSKSIDQRSLDTPALSISPSPSTAVIGIIIGGSIALVICLLFFGIWLFRRNRRQKQRQASTHEDEARSYLHLEDSDDPSPSDDRNIDTEHGDESLGTNMADRQTSSTPLRQSSGRKNSDHNNTNNNNRNTSIRRGLDTFIQRMASLRSPQSPTSIFSLFSNISSTPPPVTDKFRKVKQVHFPVGACELMEPDFFDANGTLIVNGHYQLMDDQVLTDEHARIPGYATRTIQHATKDDDASLRTLHYYPADQQNAFLRTINITVRLQESNRIISHYDALSLQSPTPRSHYQYYWISGLCMAQQSLDYLLHDQSDHPGIVDVRHFSFMSLTVHSILSCLRDVHALDCCHLGLSLRCFYFQHVSAITDWYIGRFDQAHVIGQPEGYGILLDEYSAPELVKTSTTTTTTTTTTTRHYCTNFSPRPALDCWSLGCVIYEVATGKRLFKDVEQLSQLCSLPSVLETHLQHAYDHVDRIHPSFRPCLENLLQVNPIERSSVKVVLDDWIKANQLDEDLD
ncbi:unnamed protein product [Absidia cylindrospora]